MRTNKATSIITGLLAAVAMATFGAALAGCEKSGTSAQNAASGQQDISGVTQQATGPIAKVTVGDKGFVPNSVSAKKGQPLTLEFTRTTDRTCATSVAFPELKITKELPLNVPVEVSVPTEEARTLTFQCGMGMYKSSVVVN